MESGSGPQSPRPGFGPGSPGYEPGADPEQSPPSGPQSPSQGPQSPAAPQSQGGPPVAAPGPQAPESPAGPQSPGGLQAPGYGGPMPPGGWQQAPPAAGPAAYGGQLAGWGRRFAATIIDGLIIGIPALIITSLLGVGVLGATVSESAGGLVAALVGLFVTALVFAVLALVYAPLTMMRSGEHNGQTFGKQIVGIRVIRTSGERMDFLWSALREVAIKTFGVAIVATATLYLAFLANYLWPLWDDENRALHDMAASTRVVRA